MQAFYRPGIASADAPILDVIGCGPSVNPGVPGLLCVCFDQAFPGCFQSDWTDPCLSYWEAEVQATFAVKQRGSCFPCHATQGMQLTGLCALTGTS